MTTKEEVASEIKDLLAETFELDAKLIVPEAKLIEDLVGKTAAKYRNYPGYYGYNCFNESIRKIGKKDRFCIPNYLSF